MRTVSKFCALLLAAIMAISVESQAEIRKESTSGSKADYILLPSELAQAEKKLREHHPMLVKLPSVEAWYLVQPDGSLRLLRGASKKFHLDSWNMLKKVVQGPIQNTYTTFVIFKDSTSNPLPLAVTVATGLDPYRFGLGVNAAVQEHFQNSERMLLSVLLHEYYGHAKLPTMMPGGIDPVGCLMQEQPDSALKSFAKEFWSHCDSPKKTRVRYEVRAFTSRYASNDVSEDLAETAATFVICGQPPHSAKGPAVEKLRFLWKQPEQVKYRMELRKKFDPELLSGSAKVRLCAY